MNSRLWIMDFENRESQSQIKTIRNP